MSRALVGVSIVGLFLTLAPRVAQANATVLGKPWLGSFTSLQAAANAAADGDVVLVTPGSYSAFTLDGKGLTFLGTSTTGVNVAGPCQVRNLGVKRRAALIQLTVTAPPSWSGPTQPGLRVENCNGVVWLQRSTFRGARGAYQWGQNNRGGAGVLAVDSSKVVVAGCTLYGADIGFVAGEAAIAGGHGLDALGSSVALYDCLLSGGLGSDESQPKGGNGGHGANVEGWGIFASATTIRGGHGGGGDYLGCTDSGDGGDGLRISAAQARLVASPIFAGLGLGFYTCNPGVDGQPVVSLNGAVVTSFTNPAFKLTGPARAADNTTISLTVTGQPGAISRVLASHSSGFHSALTPLGVAVLPWPLQRSIGPSVVIGPSGTATVALALPEITDPSAGRVLHLQTVNRDATGAWVLGSPHRVLIENL